ncbi:MAG: TlpA family protein disulfide reductase [Myxococcales bacterium]|nr:TlpA family protein disulfide reductase [Myxococcales bacterium]
MHKRRVADWIAAGIVFVLGAPLLWVGASAFASGEQARRQAPARALLGAQAYAAFERGESYPEHYMGNDRTAPDFALQAADGSTWRLSEHRGKVIVMNFWTVTCGPCMEEMPSLIELSRILGDRDDIELVTVSVDGDWETVRSAVPADSPMTVLLDSDRAVVNGQFGTRLFPETWIIDREGFIRLRIDGQRDWSSALAMDAFEAYL